MRKLLLIGFALVTFGMAKAQDALITVQGMVIDLSDDSALPGATVLLVNVKDSTLSKFGTTNGEGYFKIEKLERAFYRLVVSSLGYKTYSQLVRIANENVNFEKIAIEPDTKVLENINVVGEVIPMEQRGDTILYNADAFKVNPDASATDLVSKMPGIVVDQSGVSANGERIQQVLLDGKRFFGQDPLLSLNTIPAEVVNRVEVFDQMSERAQFTGIDDGNTTKTMNVVTRENKRNGFFGKLYAGGGTNDRYTAGATINNFNKSNRLTILGMSNNINQLNFSNEDLAGVGGGGQRGGFRPGGGNNNFMSGADNGIITTNSLGLNFSNNLGSKGTFEGSYFYNNSANTKDQWTNRETFRESGSQFYSETRESDQENQNHRINMRIVYDLNENNKITFLPSASFQDNNSLDYTLGRTVNDLGQTINQTENRYKSNNLAYNINNSLLFQHKFEKIGRSISFQIDSRIRSTDRENYYEELSLDSITQYLTNEFDNTISGTITYAEPIGNNGELSASYRLSYNDRDSDKDTYIIEPETGESVFSTQLSNQFSSGYTTHLPTVMYSNRNFGKFFNVGVSFQNATLNNQQFFPEAGNYGNSFNSILPTAMGRVQFGGGGNMFFRYATNTNEPSVNQLQNVIDNSNPLFISLGNPQLDQSYSHSLMMRLSKANTEKNSSLANFTRAQMTSNYITNATEFAEKDSVYGPGIIVQEGAQVSIPINLNGYWNVNNNTTYSKAISKIKSNLNTSLGLGYARRPGRTDGEENISNTYSVNLRMAIASNISESMDFNLYYNINANTVTNSVQARSNGNSEYMIQTVGGKLNYIFWKGFVFRNDIYFENYNGFSESFNTNYVLWNMSVAKKFMKNDLGELELSVFDLLSQNQSFSQNITANYLEEIRTQVLQQYFMLKFTYQIRKFRTTG